MRDTETLSIQRIRQQPAELPFESSDQTFPDARRLVVALRQVGYGLEQALSDLIDNSINAGAKNVLIRFLHDGRQVRAIATVDDGTGMTAGELKNAMRFGSSRQDNCPSLGKYGMGLKLASLSHARTLSVYTRRNRRSYGRKWTVENLSRGWWCQRLSSPVPQQILDSRWASLNLAKSGTVVFWEDLDRLPVHKSGLRYTLASLDRRLRLHLGLTFHRFLETGLLRILVDQHQIDRPGQGLASHIEPLNPFGYSESGDPGYPKTFKCNVPGVGALNLLAHVWPANSTAPEYRLGRRAASRQGFYIYRNHRLIQAGGWNGVFQDETEPHSSLARISIDLPPELDENFGINVQKSHVIVPPAFSEAVHESTSAEGQSFDDYRRAALNAYRSANIGQRNGPVVPGRGLNGAIAKQFRAGNGLDDASYTAVDFRWRSLSEDEVFRVETDEPVIFLNSLYRRALTESSSSRAADAAALKLLIFQIVKQVFERGLTNQRRRELKRLNSLLAESARLARG